MARRHEAHERPRQGPDSGRYLLLSAVAMLAVAAVARMAVAGVADVRDAVAFGALIALGELLRLNLPGDRESAPVGTAGALAYALLIRVGRLPAHHAALQVVAVTAIGMIVGALPHVAAGRPAGMAGMASRLLAVGCAAFIFRPLAGGHAVGRYWWAALAAMTLAVAAAWLMDTIIAALVRTDTLRARFWVALRDEMAVQAPLGVATGTSAMLIAFAAEVMGLAAVAVFIAPLLVTQVAFRKYAGIRATYLQTIRALARVTEIGSYVETGHADRVSRLAVAVGRELGMSEPDLLELQYAALMHDIGQLSLRDPIPGGATVLISPEDQRRIAELGAEVIHQAEVLDNVAEIVRMQSDPCRPAEMGGEGVPPDPPLSSRIIRAANAFDDLVGTSDDPGRAAAAAERLRLDVASEYDPRVVDALSKVISRQSFARI